MTELDKKLRLIDKIKGADADTVQKVNAFISGMEAQREIPKDKQTA